MSYTVKRNFLSFISGDVIEITTNGHDTLFIKAKRYIDKPFYGNEYGKFGIGNPYKKGMPQFIWVKEQVEIEVMSIKVPHNPYDKNFIGDSGFTRHLHTQYEWLGICKQKFIDDLSEQGVL